MGWRIELSRRAGKHLAAIDAPEALRIVQYLFELDVCCKIERGKGGW